MSNTVTIQFNDEQQLIVDLGEEAFLSVEDILAIATDNTELDSELVQLFITKMTEVENNELKLLINNSPKPSYAKIVSGGNFIGFALKQKLGVY